MVFGFKKIGDLSEEKNRVELWKLLLRMGVNNPDELTGICATVIVTIASIHELPDEGFRKIMEGMLDKYDEVKNDPKIQEELNKRIVRGPL